jgi:hypothetical protein
MRQPLLVEARGYTVGRGSRSRRHWVSVYLVVGLFCTWLGGTVLIAPSTALAAAAARIQHGSACAVSSVSHVAITARQSEVSIQLNQTLGTADTSLVINGADWPGDTAVIVDAYGYNSNHQLVLGQTPLVRATTGSRGTFQTAPFLAPTSFGCSGQMASYGEPGSVVIFRAHTRDNQVSAEVRFNYDLSPELTITPSTDSSGTAILPGSTFPIMGEGWEAGEWVTVTAGITHGLSQEILDNTSAVESSGEVPTRIKAGRSGEFTIQTVVPRGLTSTNAFVVSATAIGPIYGTITAPPLIFNIQPTVAPTLKANRAQGYPGATVTLTGANWLSPGILAEYCRGQTDNNSLGNIWPYEIPYLSCDPDASQGLGDTAVNSSGRFTIKVTIPDNARPGPITIQVRTASDILPGTFVLAVPFTVLIPWQMLHPRLAEALHVGEIGVPFLLLTGVGAGAAALWRRRRRSQMSQGR